MRCTVYRIVFLFLGLSVLLLTGGTPVLAEDAKARNIPIGEMVSRGEVRFEARQNSWKPVESFHFPVFKGVRLKTEKGVSVVALANQSQVEVRQQSLVSFNQEDQITLFQGGVDFRIPVSAQMSFKIGSLFIVKSLSLRTANNKTLEPARGEETIGSMSIHEGGSLTVKSIRGKLSILDQDHIVLASLSPGDTLTLPSAIVSGKRRVMIAQAAEPIEGAANYEEGWLWEGIEGEVWPAALLNVGMIGVVTNASLDDDAPFCP
jgi:hypothetical protein